METQTPFRIGGVYWNRNRDTPVLLEDCGVSGQALMVLEGGSGMALWVRARVSDGFAISPETGFDWGGEDGLSLLPGELERREGQWVPRGVPVEDKPQQEDAGKVWRPHPAVCAPALPTTERTRPALDWADSKRVDRWAEFLVTRSAIEQATPAATHPLQRIAQEGDQLHGSAFLRKG
jgi:hypothetical protein